MKINLKLSHLTRISILLAVFFGLDKAIGVLRQMLVARQFGLSSELDAFNAANNLPDSLFALISGGALAIAFIPVLSEYLTLKGKPAAWMLFSQIANLAFIVTAALAVLVALLAEPLVSWQLGIAPGFNTAQQKLVADLMRLNLIATLIFSISGLVMAGLQANQHFLLPAMAPLFYELGQIFGALVLAPTKGYVIGTATLPALGMGVHGLVYGVILGAALHLLIQVPGLVKYHFKWTPRIAMRDSGVRQVLALLGPRLLTMFFIQLIFIARDNLASRLEPGAVTALTYGWLIMQVPETLIGTAIGTALLPTLSEQIARGDWSSFRETLEKVLRVIIGITLPCAVLLAAGIRPLVELFFGFDAQGTQLVAWVTRAYLAGIVGHSLLEIASRSFYAQKDARIPLLASGLTAVLFFGISILLFQFLGAAGISAADTLAFTLEALLLLFILNRRLKGKGEGKAAVGNTLLRSVLGSIVGGFVVYILLQVLPLPLLPASVAALGIGALITVPFIWKELKILIRL